MLTLRRMVTEIMLEGLVDDLKRKYPGRDQDMDFLARAVAKKYLMWAANQVITNNEPKEEVANTLREFDRNSQRMPIEQKDITRYTSLAELRDAIAAVGQSKAQQAKITKQDADILYKTDEILVVHPKSKGASCHYGKGSKWCISASESSNYFDHYSSNNVVFYFVISRKKPPTDPYHKIAIVVPRPAPGARAGHGEPHAFTAVDHMIKLSEAQQAIGPEGSRIIAMCLADAPKRPVNPQYEAMTTQDEKRIRELAAAGQYTAQLLKNRNLPPDLRDELLKNPDDDTFYDLIVNGEIAVDEQLLRRLVEKRYMHATSAALIYGAQHDGMAVPDDLAQAILSWNDDELGYVLARCDGISTAVARQIIASNNTRWMQGLAENRSHLPDMQDEMLQAITANQNDRAFEVMFQSVGYTGDVDGILKMVKMKPELLQNEDVINNLKSDIYATMLHHSSQDKRSTTERLASVERLIRAVGLRFTDDDIRSVESRTTWRHDPEFATGVATLVKLMKAHR